MNWQPARRGFAGISEWAGLWSLFFAALVVLHWPLLHLPYFWDEAGYYIPAARDILLYGDLIPRTTLSNAHPPLVMLWLAAGWKLFGYHIVVARLAMLALSAFSLVGLFRLARRVANAPVAWTTVLCTAVYPVFLAQSSMAHVDLAAAGLVFWGLGSYVGPASTLEGLPVGIGGRQDSGYKSCVAVAVWFSLAALAKETAILAPLALLVWELVCASGMIPVRWRANLSLFGGGEEVARSPWPRRLALLFPVLPLALWFGYHYAVKGYVFGNPEFVRYNVTATLQPSRIVLALILRAWQTLGYEHLWLLTGLMLAAMRFPARHLTPADCDTRLRIAVPVQVTLLVIIAAYVAAMAVVGGAVLARYMLPAIPLVILIAVSTLWRRVRQWKLQVAAVCIWFVVGWFWNPPYEFSPEDNLTYCDFIELQQRSISYLDAHYPGQPVLTAWPATDALVRPFLGYVEVPRPVIPMENFSLPEVLKAAAAGRRTPVALVFSTKYEPPVRLLKLNTSPLWDDVKTRFFDYHHDLDPQAVAHLLGGHVVREEHRDGLFSAVIELDGPEDAGLLKPSDGGVENQPRLP